MMAGGGGGGPMGPMMHPGRGPPQGGMFFPMQHPPPGMGAHPSMGGGGSGGRGRGGGGGGGYGTMPQSSGMQVVVHNLPWSCTRQQLMDHFSEFSVERADLVLDSMSRSRGFGTVRFFNPGDAEASCERLNNSKIDERMISVRVDRFG